MCIGIGNKSRLWYLFSYCCFTFSAGWFVEVQVCISTQKGNRQVHQTYLNYRFWFYFADYYLIKTYILYNPSLFRYLTNNIDELVVELVHQFTKTVYQLGSPLHSSVSITDSKFCPVLFLVDLREGEVLLLDCFWALSSLVRDLVFLALPPV